MNSLKSIRYILIVTFSCMIAQVNAKEFRFSSVAEAKRFEKVLSKLPERLQPQTKLLIAKMYADSNIYPETVIKYAREVLNANYNMQETPLRLRTIEALELLGNLYSSYSNYDLAYTYFQKAHELYRPWDNATKISLLVISLAYTQYYRNNVDESKKLISEAYDFTLKNNLSTPLLRIYEFHSIIAEDANLLDSLEYYQLEIIKLSQSHIRTNNAYKRLAKVEQDRKNYSKAQRYSEKALEHILKTNNLPLIAESYVNLGFYSALTGDFNRANELIVQGYIFLQKDSINNIEWLRNCSFALGVVASMQDDYNLAFAHLRQYVRLTEVIEEITQQKHKKLISNQSTLLDKEKEIEFLLLNQELETENNNKVQLRFWFIVIILLTLIIISVYIIFSLRERASNQATIEKQSIELTQKKFKDEIRKIELKAVTANLEGQEYERERIAKELHDGVGGAIAGIKLELESLSEGDTEELHLQRVLSSVTNIYNEVRNISRNLSVPGFENTSFIDNIKSLVNDLSNQKDLKILFTVFPEKDWPSIPYFIQKELYRIAQEALVNVIKHAEATQVEVQFILDNNVLKGSIEDDGKGFNKDEYKNGIGLKNMTSRINNLKGDLNIDTDLGQGTFIEFTVPLNFESEQN